MNVIAYSFLITNVKAQLEMSNERPYRPGQFGSNSLYIIFKVSLVGDYFELLYSDQKTARLNKNFCSQARRLAYLGVQFQAYLLKADWNSVFAAQSKHSTASATTFAVEVNVYSFVYHANQVGEILSQAGFFLQNPAYDSGEVPYCNPQKLEFEGFEERQEAIATSADDSTAEPIYFGTPIDTEHAKQDRQLHTTNFVDSILNSLSHNSILHEISTDHNRIKTVLLP
jgi:SWI/SNF-related matrix-associated actin-dependent regulator of chromatin subfamily A3